MRENDERERIHRERVHKLVSELSEGAQEEFSKVYSIHIVTVNCALIE
jgi:hypothetical protein